MDVDEGKIGGCRPIAEEGQSGGAALELLQCGWELGVTPPSKSGTAHGQGGDT